MTNFEKICKGTPEELAEIAEPVSCDFCLEEYDAPCKYKNCRDEFVKWLNSPAPIELTQTEREICVGLKHLEYNYLARDKNGDLCAYHFKPERKQCLDYDFWDMEKESHLYLEAVYTSFDFISWEDKEPTRIDDLLGVEE